MTSYLGLKFFRTERTSTSNRSIFVPLKTRQPVALHAGLDLGDAHVPGGVEEASGRVVGAAVRAAAEQQQAAGRAASRDGKTLAVRIDGTAHRSGSPAPRRKAYGRSCHRGVRTVGTQLPLTRGLATLRLTLRRSRPSRS